MEMEILCTNGGSESDQLENPIRARMTLVSPVPLN